jgi:hypothetical protein
MDVPRLRMREVLAIVRLVGAVIGIVAAKSTSSGSVTTGRVAERLKAGRGAYTVLLRHGTTLAQARAKVLEPFPRDSKVKVFVVKAYCAVEVVTSRELERTSPSGVVAIEFVTGSRNKNSFALLNTHDVTRALVGRLDSTESTPSC